MLFSKSFITTLKETPADAEIVSHRLMLRAGLIRRLASGMYSWMPLGLRVVRKIEQIVREEMNASNALEILMPAVQPGELWQESGRWEFYGPELLRFQDRHQRDFCLGPTHEEVVTDIARRDIRSYKQLPVNLYQIQTKFRDEIRPRFGVMRAREFVMKDAYSFDLNNQGLAQSYDTMRSAYVRIFNRVGLDFQVVVADSGAIGGNTSEEFHVTAESGEDAIAYSVGGYCANVELVPCEPPAIERAAALQPLETIDTPNWRTIDELSAGLSVSADKCLKTLLVEGSNDDLVALCLRGDHQLNIVKAEKLPQVASPFTMATAERIREKINGQIGFVGPIGTAITVLADHSACVMSDFVCGANQVDKHYIGANWGRDAPEPISVDIRNVVAGEPAPDNSGEISITRGIEVGHIFQLGTKYSESMNAVVMNEDGKAVPLLMGCYGIGITRVAAAAIEQNNDDAGIIWPSTIAPYEMVIIPMNMHKSVRLADAVYKIYNDLVALGIDIILDDRPVRPGVMFADAELIGIPHRLVIGERGLDKNEVEYSTRAERKSQPVAIDKIGEFLLSTLGNR